MKINKQTWKIYSFINFDNNNCCKGKHKIYLIIYNIYGKKLFFYTIN